MADDLETPETTDGNGTVGPELATLTLAEAEKRHAALVDLEERLVERHNAAVNEIQVLEIFMLGAKAAKPNRAARRTKT